MLALAPNDRLPNFHAAQLSPGVGWLLLTAVVALVVYLMTYQESWRRIWLRLEDPRPMGLFRIVFGICALCNVNGLWEHFEYLFMDEGLFFTDTAQQVRSRSQFAGYGDGLIAGEPTGFWSLRAFLQWLKGPNYSLLLFNSSPTFFWVHLAAFEVTMIMFIVGWQTRWVKWVAWFLFHSIIMRNTVFWEGTENVYRVFFFYLCLSRCDRAFSVDNWLRCRRLRKAGRLSVPGGPGGGAGLLPDEKHPHGLEAIYRLIPAWPRMITICQIAVLYCCTGVVKNGGVWRRGDTLYYALNLDHFYRLPPQELSALFGTTLFRLNTLVVHWWEAFFPIILVGLVVRWHLREKVPGPRGWKRTVSRIALLTLAMSLMAMVIYAYPVHFKASKNSVFRMLSNATGRPPIFFVQLLVGIATPAFLLGVFHGSRYLRTRPSGARVDLDWVCRWVLGRRVWLGLGAMFHIHLIFMMNIGWFTPGLLAGYICFFNGSEIAALLHGARRNLGPKLGITPPSGPPIPAEDVRLSGHRDGHRATFTLMFTCLAIALIGVGWRVYSDPDVWAVVAKTVERKAKLELPDGLTDQIPLLWWRYYAGMAALVAIVVNVRRGHGFAMDRNFAPVLIITAALGGYLHCEDILHIGWLLPVMVGLSWAATRRPAAEPPRTPLTDPISHRALPGWAYGPFGRTVVTLLIAMHFIAVGTWLLPVKDSMSSFRVDSRVQLQPWLSLSQTTQSWNMFAPNPPRSNMFLRELVYTEDGSIWDMDSDVYACFQEGAKPEICDKVHPQPWIWYSRTGKMNRRIAGGEGGKGSWYQKWHARWLCRQWALNHDGELPKKVELIKVTYPIPTPEHVRKKGAYRPAERYRELNKQKIVHTTTCKTSINAQPTNEHRRRAGLPEVEEKKIRMWHKKRCRGWEKKLRERAKQRGEEVDDNDPRFRECSAAPKQNTASDKAAQAKG